MTIQANSTAKHRRPSLVVLELVKQKRKVVLAKKREAESHEEHQRVVGDRCEAEKRYTELVNELDRSVRNHAGEGV